MAIVSANNGMTHVHRVGQDHPVGLVMDTISYPDRPGFWFLVRWGVADDRVYEEEVSGEELDYVGYKIYQPDEIVMRQSMHNREVVADVAGTNSDS